MRFKRVWKNIIILTAVVVLTPLTGFLLVRFTPRPPEDEVEYARKVLSQAELSNAAIYSGNLFGEAKALYDSAMVNWQKENKRFIYFRNYDKVSDFAGLSARKAEAAMRNSLSNVSNLHIKLKFKIDTLNNLVVHFNRLFKSYPLSAEIRNRISKGKLLLKESEVAYSKGDFLQADKKISDSELFLTDSYEEAVTHLKEYFNSFPLWEKWIDRTIRESRQNKSYSIIIDKYSRKCIVYLGGAKKYEFNVELSQNWVGDKRVKGDKATPEGMYKVIRKFGNNKTKYHKALLIDYPNATDKQEFQQDIASGTLPKSANIGSLIEIHGDGGRGLDWTDGCIALPNSEMDVVFRIAMEGTPVTIVGSMVNIGQILN
jgi:hypothetical protein